MRSQDEKKKNRLMYALRVYINHQFEKIFMRN